MATSIFSLFGEIFVDNDRANKSIDDTTKKGEGLGSKLSSAFGAVAKGAAALGAGAVAAGAAIYKMADNTAQATDRIDKGRQALGMSVEGYQEWAYVLSQNGADIDKLGTAMKTLSNVMDGSSKQGVTALEKLGVSFQGLNQEEAFAAAVTGLQGLSDETLKAQIAQDLFGRQYQDLMPLLNQTAEGTSELTKRAHDLGLVMSSETVDAGVKLGDTLDDVKGAFGMLVTELGASLMPMVQTAAEFLLSMLPTIKDAFDRLAPVFQSLAETLMPVLAELITMLLPPLLDIVVQLMPLFEVVIKEVLPPILDLIKALLPPIIDLVETLLPPVIGILEKILPFLGDLVEAILPVIVVLLEALTPILEPLLEVLNPILDVVMLILDPLLDLLNLIIPPLTAVIEALAKIVSGALKGAFEGIQPIVDSVKKVFENIIDFIKNVFSGNWEAAWGNVKNIFSGIFDGIVAVAEKTINGIISIINGIIEGINAVSGLVGIPEIPTIGKVNWTNKVTSTGTTTAKIQEDNMQRSGIGRYGSYATGIEYVPYDDFPALLHEGERVQTAAQARADKAGATVNINGATILRPDDIDWLADLLVGRLREAGVLA